MPICGNCHHSSVPPSTPTPILQIRHGYRARWNDLAFQVENDNSGWALRVLDSAKHELYRAHRIGPQAARVAAAEYAIFRVLGPASAVQADCLASELNWQPYW
ncbi:MAG TPA: hypothetical protein VMB03_14765 [Bryobacteraceae bacterium]|nr:hypothetical protein [Bryobacteraceae bacterium]